MGLRDVVSKVGSVARRHGWRAAAQLALSRLQPHVVRVDLYGREHSDAPAAETSAAGIEMAFASREELLQECRAGRWGPQRLLAVEGGDRCLRQYVDGELAGYTWVSVREAVPVRAGVYLGLPADTAYVYKAFTSHEYRGRGLQALRTRELGRILEAEGRGRLLCFVHQTNFGSIRGVRRGGYRRVGSIRIVRGAVATSWVVRFAEPSWVVEEEA